MNDAERLRNIALMIQVRFGEDVDDNVWIDLRCIASDLERKAVSDEEIEAYAMEKYKYDDMSMENAFVRGAEWMREKLTGKS